MEKRAGKNGFHDLLRVSLTTIAILSFIFVIPSQAVSDNWVRINNDGFSTSPRAATVPGANANKTYVGAMTVFGNNLYASASNNIAAAGNARVYKIPVGDTNAAHWKDCQLPLDQDDKDADAMAVFKGALYVGTAKGRLWRTMGNTPADWKKVNPIRNNSWSGKIWSMAVYKSMLYLAQDRPAKIWCSPDGLNWKLVVPNAFGDPHNNYSVRLAVDPSRDILVAGTGVEMPGSPVNGCEIWATSDGTNWKQINQDGFGTNRNAIAASLISFNGDLYVGTINHESAKIWRYKKTVNTWESVYDPCQSPCAGDIPKAAYAMAVFQGSLSVGLGRAPAAPLFILKSHDGKNWAKANEDGFRDQNNSYVSAMTTVSQKGSPPTHYLYAGTYNSKTGAEVWMTSNRPFSRW
jgi:hypothetical protein